MNKQYLWATLVVGVLAAASLVLFIALAIVCIMLIYFYPLFWMGFQYANRWPEQETMVISGYTAIVEAREMDELFEHVWHRVSNYREPNNAQWQSESVIAGRYELSMAIPIRVDRETGDVFPIGRPSFTLAEIQEVTFLSNGAPGVSFQSSTSFGPDQWRQLVATDGDLTILGLSVEYTEPVPGVDAYIAYPRNGTEF